MEEIFKKRNAPNEWRGMLKVYEETFRSGVEVSTPAQAEKVLQSIRDNHPESAGWLEISSGVEHLPNGMYKAIRHHAKYR